MTITKTSRYASLDHTISITHYKLSNGDEFSIRRGGCTAYVMHYASGKLCPQNIHRDRAAMLLRNARNSK